MIFIKKTLNIGFVMITFVSLLLALYQISLVKEGMPWFDNQYQAWKYERLAKGFRPGTIQQKRYSAIAEAYKKGERNYLYEYSGPLPIGK